MFKDDDKNKNVHNADTPKPAAAHQPAHQKEEDDDIEGLLTICKELDLPPINLSKYKIQPNVIKLIPEDLARTYKVIPIAKSGNTLTIAISDPFDIVAIDSIKTASRSDIHLVISSGYQITRSIEEYYSAFSLEEAKSTKKAGVTEEEMRVETVGAEDIDAEKMKELSQRAQIVELVDDIISAAVNQRASDIHIEPFPDSLRVRYRIDGVLQERSAQVDKKYEAAIIARIKIMSKLDITQRRLPQDGRISVTLSAKEIDLRISILPLVTGEKVVMRILEKGGLAVDLEKLGFSAYAFEAFKNASSRPHGMIIITGPTGSGKSTTLYAILNRLNNITKNIITIEDPVEYQMKGITQIQVKSDIGLNFASVLRAVLRQNPDICMVGEIRDYETVDIAIKSALTGHLILSTLHTNDAPSAIVRLMNMGVEPFLISSTLTLIAAQRLCRKVCAKCKYPYEVSVETLAGMPKGFSGTKATMYKGKGCSVCNGTGYYGRVAIVEAMIIDDTLRHMILKKESLTKIRDYALSQGMKTLREDALEKCLAGDISLDEALRVTPEG
ncbi:MAG: GspE/PulE family protein [Candidatus Omnitrophota bacterium]